MLSLGIAVFVGMNSFLINFDKTINSYLKENNYPDIVIETKPFNEEIYIINDNSQNKTQEELIQEYLDENGYENKFEALRDYKKQHNINSNDEAIEQIIQEYSKENIEYTKTSIINIVKDITGVIDADTRIYFNTVLNHNSRNILTKIIAYKNNKFNNFYFWQQTEKNNNYYNIYVEKDFAQTNNINIGDVVNVEIEDNNYKAYVQAIVTTPENLGSGVEYASTEINYGYIYVDQDELSLEDYEGYANQILVKCEDLFSNEIILNNVIDEITKQDIQETNSYTFEQSDVKERINRNTEPISIVCKVVPTIIYIVTLIILYMCFSIIIKSSRKNISIYRAIGIDSKKIILGYCIFGVIIITISSIVCIPFYYLIVHILSNFYESFFNINYIPEGINVVYMALSYLIAFAMCELAILLNSKTIVSYTPNEALTRNEDENNEVPLLVRTVFNNAKPIFKFSLTTSLRNKIQLVFTMLCITCTVALIYSSLSYVSGNDEIINNLFNERINANVFVYFSEEPSDEMLYEIQNLNYIESVEEIKVYKKHIKLNDLSYEVVINGIDENSQLIKIPNIDSLSETGIVLDHYSANKINAKVGDYITVDNQTIKVTAIDKQYANRTQYISYNQASKLSGSDYYCYALKCNDTSKFIDYIKDNDIFLSYNNIEEMKQRLENTFASFRFVTEVLIVFSIIIGFDVVLICIKTNYLDRAKQISVLRALGFTTKDISLNYFKQILIELFISICVGLPIGKTISTFTLKLVETSDRTYPYANGIKEVVFTVSIVLLYSIIAQLISTIEIKNWILSEKIKDGE